MKYCNAYIPLYKSRFTLIFSDALLRSMDLQRVKVDVVPQSSAAVNAGN